MVFSGRETSLAEYLSLRLSIMTRRRMRLSSKGCWEGLLQQGQEIILVDFVE